MSAVLLAFDALLLLVTAFTVSNARKLWRNERGPNPDLSPGGWLWGEAAWRGFVRSLAVVAPLYLSLYTAMLLSATAFTLAGIEDDGGAATLVVFAFAAAGTFVLLAGHAAVALLNRPKWAVAPHLRAQPGMLAEWMGARVPMTDPPQPASERPREEPGNRS